ncbi:hypothetical protein Ddye_002092 [Dipteronia dyeriana]|uniref:Uncharacterized protein n=1 Tax=Dipteronia dyeriana TaxID=168575 RepID=A0AAD9XR43_9ROSI|nr:hypothetical protein Ddye_002092 [Dipteronia dyeriana]
MFWKWREAEEALTLPFHVLSWDAEDIVGDSCFSLGMVTHFEPTLLKKNAWMYSRLFWETRVLGYMLYLERHSIGISATGIGCFFYDLVHKLLGLRG